MRVSPSTKQTLRKRRSTLENTPETPRRKSMHKGIRRILQDETQTSSMERPRTKSGLGDKKEQQCQEKSFIQNDEFDTVVGELTTP